MIILLLFCIDTCIPLYYTNLKNESLLKQQEVKRMDILCVGEMLADVLVHPVQNIHFNNDCTVVNEITIKPGGDSFNNSIDLAKLGNNVCYIGRIGSDAVGEYLLKQGQEAGIDMDHIVRSPNPHAKMNILIHNNGNRSFLYYPGTSAEFCVDDIDFSVLDDCRIVTVGGTFHLTKFDGSGTKALFQEAKKRNVITAMDVTKDFSGRWNQIIECCYPYLDYFLPSIEQAEQIAGTPDEQKIAGFLLERGVKNVAIKLGSRGCYFQNQKYAFYCGCYQVPVVETTGAGDAFVSGFLTGVLKGYSPERCVRLGTACSAQVIQEVGANAGIKDLSAIQTFICEQPPLKISYV